MKTGDLQTSTDASLGAVGSEGLSVQHQIVEAEPLEMKPRVAGVSTLIVFQRAIEKGQREILGELKRLRKEISTLSQKIDHVQRTQVEERAAALERFRRMDLDFQDLKLEITKPNWMTGWIKRFWAWLARK